MTEVREVSVEYSRTVNLGNYESERVQVGLAATLAPDERAEMAIHSLAAQARSTVEAHLQELERQRQAARHRAYRIAEAGEPEDDGPPQGDEA